MKNIGFDYKKAAGVLSEHEVAYMQTKAAPAAIFSAGLICR